MKIALTCLISRMSFILLIVFGVVVAESLAISPIRVKVVYHGSDQLKTQTINYVTQELNELSYVIIVDENPNFICEMTTLVTPQGKIVLLHTILAPLSEFLAEELLEALIGRPVPDMLLQMISRQQMRLFHSLTILEPEELKNGCKNLVNAFNEYFEEDLKSQSR